ncbi:MULTISPECIES: ATP-binding protein [Acidobacterium]|uniref:histidine kinase n=1 Tax=Acidobacterium capsulatum (strain ATCC 51196 / DSM 11244 / BCRC 80197 / JCM 7670 / NBRC 15755 / NCIMB 13165 / 161) TaxID=240015 RepID=C1F3E8_ACIC5|nr:MULTISPECIES: ATP-binding protein [Acidobacterium]ACO32391.1 sporulation kinase A, putative [Acidobacterium capsulatum ATCC 51196]HCT60174.1 PAS domain S-box protein [Acidobacterium sp.]
MHPDKFRRLLAAALAVPLVALAALGLFFAVLLHYDARAHEKLNKIDTVVTATEQLQDLIGTQEALARRHEIAGGAAQQSALVPLHTITRIRMAELQKMALGDPRADALLETLNDQYLLWMGWAQETLAGKTFGLTIAQNDARGWQQMSSIHETLRELLDLEHERRERQAAAIASFKRHTIEAIALSALLLGLLLATLTRQSLTRVSRSYRKALNEQERISGELARSRQWLQTTLESIGEGVLCCDAEGRVTFVNATAARLTGWQAAEAMGRAAQDVFVIVDETSRRPREHFWSADHVDALLASWSGQSLLLGRDGSECLVDHTASCIQGPGNEFAGMVLVFRDVTDRLRTERALQTTEKLAVAGRLAASIAHEIHNPLDAIANLHYLIETEEDPQLQREHLKMAKQELARTIQITRTMLSLYRESEHPVPVIMSELTQGVLLLLERRAMQQNITVEQNYEGHCRIEGFPAELRQVMTNVLVNAMDAAGPGGRIQVRIEDQSAEELRGSGVLIRVVDSGPGLSGDTGNRLFKPFFTTKGEAGTGLGLWVSLGIVQKHGGSIRIYNSCESSLPGACVEIYLPARVLQLGIHRLVSEEVHPPAMV